MTGTERTPTASYNVAEARRRLSELINRVAYGGETIRILRNGRPAAVITPDPPHSTGNELE